jgi:two-component system sensor histidine kinase FlrB
MVTSSVSAPYLTGQPIPGIDPVSLAEAFSSFTEAAASLERSYAQLQGEVTRLRRELEQTNRDLVRSLEENRQMRERLNRILEALPCGVVAIEADCRVILANPEAGRLLGASGHTGFPSWMRELLQHVPPDGGELEFQAEAGAEWMAVRRAELGGEAGGSSIFIVEDISGLKRLEREHEVLRRRQALAEMSVTLAHEIRNPLGSLELFAGLLAGSELGDEEQGWVRHLQAGLRTLAATVNNVLHFYSQPQPGLAPVDLGEILSALAQFLRPQSEAAGVRLVLQERLDPVRVAADRHRVEQVILNLALNAFRFMPQGGVLKILCQTQVRDRGWKALVEIADTGPGIPPENAERIFQPGFTTRAGSPGLGLAVSKTIMEQHGGAIRVLPGLGGARFELEFPVLRSGQ